ncbi:MAG TPA: nitrile hydratase subunit beta [Rhodopila sp.]|jgi:nitrile hydratase subunit beta|nr:nitrile hydratase subunit beta [Rhodopila sp.]
MKLQHSLGGLEGLEPSDFDLRVFAEPWEKRIFGIHTAMMALSAQVPLPPTPSGFRSVWTWADLRTAAEAMQPFDYFKYRYYEKWLGGVCAYLVANGYLTEQELEARTQSYLQKPDAPLPSAAEPTIDTRVRTYLMGGVSPQQKRREAPWFKTGDRVVVGDPPTIEHTRLPGFLRNKPGIVESVYEESYTYLSTTGDGIGPAMPVYCVSFDPQDLWPNNAEPGFRMYADLYQAYLRPPAG